MPFVMSHIQTNNGICLIYGHWCSQTFALKICDNVVSSSWVCMGP